VIEFVNITVGENICFSEQPLGICLAAFFRIIDMSALISKEV
jgi:hypothetical protein